VGNAVKFTEKGEVALRVALESQSEHEVYVHFAVRDTGIGIPPSKRDRLFKAFSQMDASTTRRYGGTGLGLAIAAQLVDMMHGKIWVESEPGHGSTFHFTARFLKAQEGMLPEPVRRRPSVQLDSLRGMPVLVVDDNATNRRILHGLLTNWGLKPTTASHGADALSYLEQARLAGHPFELVILDNMMPEMDGFTLAEQITQQPDHASAVLMMISSAGRREDAQRCRELGVSAYLTKPIRRAELMNTLLSVLSPAEAHETPEPVERASLGRSACRLHVLLTEDNLVNQKLGARLLEKRGHTVVIAGNGREALIQLAAQTFDVVLMDVQMPEMDGLEATSTIRRQEQVHGGHVPIVAMTAHAMKGDRERCLDAGMDAYVSKPLQPRELYATLERLAEAHQKTRCIASTLEDAPPDTSGNHAGRIACDDPPAPSKSSAAPDAASSPHLTFDRLGALDSVGGDEQLLTELAEVFLQEAPQLLEQIEHAMRQRNAKQLQRAAHTLKGAASAFRAVAVGEFSHRLEVFGANNDLSEAERVFRQLQQAMQQLAPELESLVSK
jgi:CheY-like chemotaxis protein/anti-sigma regulatory factor (Ser/Thr protein kinase)